MLLTSHLDNLHNVTDLKMHGEEDPFPFSVAALCGTRAARLLLAVWWLLLGPYVTRNVGGQGQTLRNPGSLTDTGNITTGKQLQFSVPVPYQQNK